MKKWASTHRSYPGKVGREKQTRGCHLLFSINIIQVAQLKAHFCLLIFFRIFQINEKISVYWENS